MIVELARFARATPIGALNALFPPPQIFGKIFVRLSSRPAFMRSLHGEFHELKTLILPTTGFESWMNSMLTWLRKLGVPSVLVPDNWDNLTSKNSLAVLPDAIVVMGDSSARGLSKNLGIPMEILWPIGIPKFSSISTSPFGPGKSVPRVLFLGFSLPYDEIATMNSLYRKLKANFGENFVFHYKPHPNRKPRSIREEEVDKEIHIIRSKSKYVLPELDSDYNAFLHAYHVVISPPTTMLLEFLLAGSGAVLLDNTMDNIHRTTPGIFSRKWLHVSDLDCLDLPKADGSDELFTLVSDYLSGERGLTD
ncbi:hypothetical protein N9N06_04190, partial [Aquiluna sp.]|nr:hypothetical protein [Aquiluna sp.]